MKTKIMIYFVGEWYLKDIAMLKGTCVRQSNVCVSPIFFSRFGGPKRGYFKQILSFWTSWFSVRYPVGVFFCFFPLDWGMFPSHSAWPEWCEIDWPPLPIEELPFNHISRYATFRRSLSHVCLSQSNWNTQKPMSMTVWHSFQLRKNKNLETSDV